MRSSSLLDYTAMFTGIVQAIGRVADVSPGQDGLRLGVDLQGWTPPTGPPKLGDSVCVNGVCLTVVQTTGSNLTFDVVPETVSKTTLGQLRSGALVNLEAALTLQTPVGGHFLQGHADGVGQIARIEDSSEQRLVTIQPAALRFTSATSPQVGVNTCNDLMSAIIPRGSVAVDGVSLTAASVDDAAFRVALIPTTLKHTTLGDAREGDHVNIETDMISRTVVHWLQRQRPPQLG